MNKKLIITGIIFVMSVSLCMADKITNNTKYNNIFHDFSRFNSSNNGVDSITYLNGLHVQSINIGVLLVNKNKPLDLNRSRRDLCSINVRQSTIKKMGKGGVQVLHKGWDGYTIDSIMDGIYPK